MIYSNYGADYGDLNNVTAVNVNEFGKHEYSNVSEDEIFNKIQQLLDCNEMEEAHEFLYSINMDELTDDIISKVNALYDLAVDRGFIALNSGNDVQTSDQETAEWAPEEDPPETVLPDSSSSTYVKGAKDNSAAIDSAYRVWYSAVKDGKVTFGECYSNAADTQSAKVDAISKLANLGFDKIEIFAVDWQSDKVPDLNQPEEVTPETETPEAPETIPEEIPENPV